MRMVLKILRVIPKKPDMKRMSITMPVKVKGDIFAWSKP